MFDTPGSNQATTYNAYDYYQYQIDGYLSGEIPMTDTQLQALHDEIQKDIDLTADEIGSLIGQFTELGTSTATATTATSTAAGWQSNFALWYRNNFIIISLAQWIILFFILLKSSKHN